MTVVRIVQSQSVLGAALPRVLLQCFFVLLLRLGELLLVLSGGFERQEENAAKRDAPGAHHTKLAGHCQPSLAISLVWWEPADKNHKFHQNEARARRDCSPLISDKE